MKKFAIILTLLFSLVIILPKFNPTDDVIAAPPSDRKRALVKFSIFTPGFARRSIIQGQGAQIEESTRVPNTVVIKVPEDKADKVLNALNRNIFVDYAEEDFVAEKAETPNDPLFTDQWGLNIIGAEEGWNVERGSANVRIAILDTGVNSSHPDLSGKISSTVNCIYYSCPSMTSSDPDGHATHVAGIAAAETNNSLGIAGVNWESQIMSVKVLDDRGSGYYSWIANGLYWAADNGADVINLSLSGGSDSKTLENAVNYAWNHGVVVVAAAGNNGRNLARYPAYYKNAIAVAATDENDRMASFSNYGNWVDVAAPGVDILSTYHSSYDYLSGTSMSTPIVSGLAALIKSEHPGYSNSQIRDKMQSSSDDINGTGSYWKYGRINVCRALDCTQAPPSPSLTPTPTSSATPTPTNVTPTASPTPTATSSPTPTLTPTNSPSPTPTAVASSTPTPISAAPTMTPIPPSTPTPIQSNLPWWCVYIPWHYTCQ
jgi:thermitase